MEPVTIASLQSQYPDIDVIRMLRNQYPPAGRTPESMLWHQLGPIARIQLRAQVKESK